jgi:hypothetical protein
LNDGAQPQAGSGRKRVLIDTEQTRPRWRKRNSLGEFVINNKRDLRQIDGFQAVVLITMSFLTMTDSLDVTDSQILEIAARSRLELS